MIAKIRNFTAYQVKGDTDCEGRGPRYVVGYYDSSTLANKVAQGKGAMGSMGYVDAIDVVELTTQENEVIYYIDRPIKVHTVNPEELKAAALKKVQSVLTKEELDLLNIKG